jgi:hypothetical protein
VAAGLITFVRQLPDLDREIGHWPHKPDQFAGWAGSQRTNVINPGPAKRAGCRHHAAANDRSRLCGGCPIWTPKSGTGRTTLINSG